MKNAYYTANGWTGSRYDSTLTIKQIAARVRSYLKTNHPGYKFSVRSSSSMYADKLTVEMLEVPVEVYKTIEQLTAGDRAEIISRANRREAWPLSSWTDAEADAAITALWSTEYGRSSYGILSDEIQAVADAVDAVVKSYNRSDSDGMIDYFDEHFYYFGCIQGNGRDLKTVPRPATA